ncbi:InlB B-repeat-containing protein [Paenibacillus agaridevorans]|uniref:InlB B-repeat-containing protein n=1 Tax=Paenibacillus agaridevorans TaxID=171404 RepID=UPI001BE48D15|nr:InlB B-repeat-containing protein [Paenibacillus agaridevorans]
MKLGRGLNKAGKWALVLLLAGSMGWGVPNKAMAEPEPGLDPVPQESYVFDGMFPGGAYYFDQVMDVATDREGNVYAAEQFSHRIVKLSPNGEVMAEWQGESSISPRAITVDGEGFVYVGSKEQVHKIDMTAMIVENTWHIADMDVSGMAVDADGENVYVADYSLGGIRILDTMTDHVEEWTSFYDSSEVERQFDSIVDVALDDEGNVFVMDRDNRIIKMNGYGAYLDMLEGGEQFGSLHGITVDETGRIYATDYDENAIIAMNASFEVLATHGSDGMGAGEFDSPQGIAVAANGSVYVADTSNRRVQKLDADTLEPQAVWGSYGSAEGQFFIPEGIAVDGEGHIYIADQGNERIQLFDREFAFIAARDGEGSYFSPYGLAVDEAGRLYMTSDSALLRFDPTSNGVTHLNETSYLSNPGEVAVDADGFIYVANTSGYKIVKFDASGDKVLEMEGVMSPGSFYFPTTIAVDSVRGIVYSGDSTNIQTFKTGGEHLQESWGEPEGGAFGYISGMAVDNEGNLFVTDEGNSRIQKFNSNGELIASWGAPGKGEGEFDGLAAIAVDRAGNVYVTETGNHRVQKFAPSTHEVSFESNGGSAVEAVTVEHGDTVEAPEAPTRMGYAFGGWYTDEELTEPYVFMTVVTGNVTLYAKWTKSVYTVSFESNGGSAVEAVTVEHGDTVEAPEAPTRTGYAFGGWYTDEELTESYVFTTVVTGNVTLYAKWTLNTYTVSFESNGGSAVESATVEHGDTVEAPEAPTRTGYAFGGWYTDEELTEPYVFTTVVTGNVTLYAKWTINVYTMSFESNGGSIVEPVTVKHGDTMEAPEAPTRTGYAFGGWYTDEELTEPYVFTTVVTGNVTLYAKWTISVYTVSFESNGGNAVEATTVEHGDTVEAPEAPTRTGYAFGGWYTDEELTEPYVFTTTVTGHVTLYAKWTLNTYTVSFESNGGSAVEAVTVEHGDTVEAPEAPARTGYAFGGWYTDEELTEPYVFTTTVTGHVTLYAKWTLNTYTVSFESNGGNAVEATTVEHGDTVEAPEAPARTGYAFGGWYTDEELTEPYVFTTTVTGHVTLYAKWTAQVTETPNEGGTVYPTPTPTPAAGDEKGLLINGKQGHADITGTTDGKGRKVTTVIIDWNKDNQTLAGDSQGTVLEIEADAENDVLAAELSMELLKALIDRGGKIQLRTAFASYAIDASLLDLDALLEQLGPNGRAEDAVVRIEIAPSNDRIVRLLKERADVGDFQVIAPPVHFAVWVKAGDLEIEANNFAAYVERTISIPNGVNRRLMSTGVVIDPDGTVRHVPTRMLVNNGKYAGAMNSLTNSDYALIGYKAAFDDMKGHWASSSVHDMGSRLIIEGIGEGLFAPDRSIKRAEFAAILVRALGLGQNTRAGFGKFSDVREGDWYAGAIGTAYEYGLIGGFEDGTFRPNDDVTREQAMIMIANAMGWTGLTDKADAGANPLSGFPDAAQASAWAEASLNKGLATGILSGTPNGELAPGAKLTRAQAAVMVQRLLKESGLI